MKEFPWGKPARMGNLQILKAFSGYGSMRWVYKGKKGVTRDQFVHLSSSVHELAFEWTCENFFADPLKKYSVSLAKPFLRRPLENEESVFGETPWYSSWSRWGWGHRWLSWSLSHRVCLSFVKFRSCHHWYKSCSHLTMHVSVSHWSWTCM